MYTPRTLNADTTTTTTTTVLLLLQLQLKIRDIFFTEAHFVSNFIAMAMEIGWGKMRIAAFDGPTPKPPAL